MSMIMMNSEPYDPRTIGGLVNKCEEHMEVYLNHPHRCRTSLLVHCINGCTLHVGGGER